VNPTVQGSHDWSPDHIGIILLLSSDRCNTTIEVHDMTRRLEENVVSNYGDAK
jgi:hypothetical protein